MLGHLERRLRRAARTAWSVRGSPPPRTSNQPELHKEAQRLLWDKANRRTPEVETAWESDSSRGWIKRQMWRTSDMAGWDL